MRCIGSFVMSVLKPKFFFNIDIIGVCNLKCPSCPTGNYKSRLNPTGKMSLELLDEILNKASNECKVTGVGLFNWNEPLLHPEIAACVRLVQERGIKCHLSSNLNKVGDLDILMNENPASFRISMSGYRQEIYQKTHRGGNVEVVKQNMEALANAKRRTGATTDIHVLFHRYKSNLGDELMLRQYTEDLGFEFKPTWAMFMPLEKALGRDRPSQFGVACSEEDNELIDSLLLPLDDALAVSRSAKAKACPLRDSQITIDVTGRTQLCCAVFDLDRFSIGSYLETSLPDLQERKYSHEMCRDCMALGSHYYGTATPTRFDEMTVENASPEYRKMLSSAPVNKPKKGFWGKLGNSVRKRAEKLRKV